ncbi:class I SAM-dependent methyltransferase [Nocardia transvalensis]|uniref:class I SAM-dependent methyltransferase n=1 Tax=Nocardia transvalensis TaxID=37333 RepID=UPI001895CB4A|nr:class I SAM-dependent methyltransferase [Nocardia transvalensis]MBF6331913.1 class I SAM-dependent methyltransferase [Nocardia transvalensis]
MTTAEFDPVSFKRTQRTNWNAISEGWMSCLGDFETGGAPVTARLLELGGVKPGHRVLDVGTGIGEPALSAAAVVGPTGKVTGIDLAPDMIARARARAHDVDNVEFVVGDVESLEFPAASFDVVLSRWGLMFAVDRVETFRTLARVLVPGGVLAAAVWAMPWSDVPMMSLGFQVLSTRLELPPASPGAPGPFSMGDPQTVGSELAEAGFDEVEVTASQAPFVLESPERYIEFNKVVSPPGLKDMLRQRFGSEDDPDTWAAVGKAVEPYRTSAGRISLPSKTLLLRAVAPIG